VLTAIVASPSGGGGGGGGKIEAMILFELPIMLATVSAGESPTGIWSFLEPLRPALSLPFMVVATNKAATAKHATMILRGVEKVMVEIRYAETTE
jgi:homoserine dehydrogenase